MKNVQKLTFAISRKVTAPLAFCLTVKRSVSAQKSPTASLTVSLTFGGAAREESYLYGSADSVPPGSREAILVGSGGTLEQGRAPGPGRDDAAADEAGLDRFRSGGKLVCRVRVEVGEASLDPSEDDYEAERVSILQIESGEVCCMESDGLCCTYS